MPADWALHNSRALPYLPEAERERFRTAIELHARNKSAEQTNMRHLVKGVRLGSEPEGLPRGAFVHAWNNNQNARVARDEDASGLPSKQWFPVNAPMMLITNLWTEAGLTNGLRGVLHDLVCLRNPWEEGSVPECAILRVDHEYDEKAQSWRSPVEIDCCLPELSTAAQARGRPCRAVFSAS